MVATRDRRESGESRAAAYAASFERLCAGTVATLLDAADVPPGTRLLDVGTGTGTVARAACRRGAAVTALDADASMCASTRAAVPAARVVRAALPHVPLRSGVFDVVTANFVINHVGDPRAGVADLRRVVRSGGVVAVSIWPAGPSAITDLWADVVAAAGLHMPPPDVLPPELDFPRTAAGLRDLLTGAGLGSVVVQDVQWTLRTDPAQLWRGPAAGLAGIGRVVSAQPAQVRDRMHAAYLEVVAERCVLGVLRLPAAALAATGRVPPGSLS